ncbi:MAG: aminopeptidase N [Alphaproteobacteria bacterium]
MKDNQTAIKKTPKTVYRKDYKKPDYLVDDLDLTFDVGEDITKCRAVMEFRASPDKAASDNTVFLDGDELNLSSIAINGKKLKEGEYKIDETGITLTNVPDKFTLEVITDLKPKENMKLQGLYESNGVLCTKCETEGFRRITFFPDRPDVMAKYTTTIIADKEKLPVLLSNGNKVDEGETKDGRHFVKWHDPHPKPSYLFALVAGDLDQVSDKFTTKSGNDVDVFVFVEKGKADKADFALASIKKAMKWDEENFDREYNLNNFKIVAVSNFNSGACENTSLNIFNDKYVLANPRTATDSDYEDIEGVIGHEFFHHWSGNLVTLATWFDLTLKEGFTVYRDQEFSSDMRSDVIKRINDVQELRAGQFVEDAGPMAHPVRPDSYISVRNVYTGTVYNKGAEVIRMQEKILGTEAFRKAAIHYFNKNEGKAVTCDDFVKALEESSGKDLKKFKDRWYTQAGTPTVKAEGVYNPETKTYELTLSQKTKPTPGQPIKKPFVIPLEMGLVDAKGNDIPLKPENYKVDPNNPNVVVLENDTQKFVFKDVNEKPVISINRGFTSPINTDIAYTNDEKIHLIKNDKDLFNRWDICQKYALSNMLQMTSDIEQGKKPEVDKQLVTTLGELLSDKSLDKSFVAKMFELPTEKFIADNSEVVNPDAISKARQVMTTSIASELKDKFFEAYKDNDVKGAYSPEPEDMGQRAIKNTALRYLAKLDDVSVNKMLVEQYYQSDNMTDKGTAIGIIAHSSLDKRDEVMNDFYQDFKKEGLVVDKWFRLQATAPQSDCLDNVKKLLDHEAFDIKNPNKVRSLVGAFTSNQTQFHAADGSGYEFLADFVKKYDVINPQIAANLLKPLGNWKQFDEGRQELMKKELRKVMDTEGLSSNTYEVVAKSLAMEDDKSAETKKRASSFFSKDSVKTFQSGSKAVIKKNTAAKAKSAFNLKLAKKSFER